MARLKKMVGESNPPVALFTSIYARFSQARAINGGRPCSTLPRTRY